MRKYLYLVLIFVLGFTCLASSEVSFKILVGDKPSQLGYLEGDGFPIGPSAISEYQDEICILDKVNFKMNFYSANGEFKYSFPIPQGYNYYDVAINSKMDILVLTDKGIFIKIKTTYKKLCDIPSSIGTPYYFFVNTNGIIVLNGLDNKGRVKSVMINANGNYRWLDGYGVFFSNSGLIGLQVSDTEFKIIQGTQIINTIKLNLSSTMTPIGFTDDMSVYCVEPKKQGLIIYKINKEGKINKQEIVYSSELIEGPPDIIKFLRVTQTGEIVGLEVHEKECKVLRIKF